MDWGRVAELVTVLAAFLGGQQGIKFIQYKINGRSGNSGGNSFTTADKDFLKAMLRESLEDHRNRMELIFERSLDRVCRDMREAIRNAKSSS